MTSAHTHTTWHTYANTCFIKAQRLHGVRNVFSHDHGPPSGMRHEREIAKERPCAPKMRRARLLLLLRRRHGCREGCMWPTAQPHGPGRLCRWPLQTRFSAVHARATPHARASRVMHARMTEMHARMHDMRGIPPHRAHVRIRRASLCTPDRGNVPTNENSGAASKCLRQSTHRVQKHNHACMRATRTRHRPGAPSSKGRPTRTSRLFRGSESGDSIWLLEAQEGVALFGSCGSGSSEGRTGGPLRIRSPNSMHLRSSTDLVNICGPNLGVQISGQKSVHRFVQNRVAQRNSSKCVQIQIRTSVFPHAKGWPEPRGDQ